MTDTPNYAHWLQDDANGLPYITEVATLKRIYKHPPCRICGVTRTSYSPTYQWPECVKWIEGQGCVFCDPSKRERNDNDPDGLSLAANGGENGAENA